MLWPSERITTHSIESGGTDSENGPANPTTAETEDHAAGVR